MFLLVFLKELQDTWTGMVVYPDVGTIGADEELYMKSSRLVSQRAPKFQVDLKSGAYVMLQSTVISPEMENFHPRDEVVVDELEQGQEIKVVEVVNFHDEKKVQLGFMKKTSTAL